MTSERDKEILAEMDVAAELLDAFGLSLSGFWPGLSAWLKPGPGVSRMDTGWAGVMGVSGRGYSGEPISMGRAAWVWLKPLLEELKKRREGTFDANSETQDRQT
jgi:hypothetical protein